MKGLRRLRRLLYRSARVLGDVDAASRGPSAYAKRQARKRVYREEGKLTRRLFR